MYRQPMNKLLSYQPDVSITHDSEHSQHQMYTDSAVYQQNEVNNKSISKDLFMKKNMLDSLQCKSVTGKDDFGDFENQDHLFPLHQNAPKASNLFSSQLQFSQSPSVKLPTQTLPTFPQAFSSDSIQTGIV